MARMEGGYKFLGKDKHGFLHGEIRVEAVKVLRKQGRVKEIVVVGGPTEDGTNKVELIANMIGGTVTKLESMPSTRSNLDAIKSFLGEGSGNNGLLTNFYHLPRATRLATEKGLNLIPICAEAILLTDSPHWLGKIKSWYDQDSMLTRILSEIQGLSHLEGENYNTYISQYG